jgi:hypothetical protein
VSSAVEATHLVKRRILVLGVEQLELLCVGQPVRLLNLLLGLGELCLERGDVGGRELLRGSGQLLSCAKRPGKGRPHPLCLDQAQDVCTEAIRVDGRPREAAVELANQAFEHRAPVRQKGDVNARLARRGWP